MSRRIVLLWVLLVLIAGISPSYAQNTLQLTYTSLSLPNDVGYNVRNYGARGDGTTDDTAAIQALLNQLRPSAGDYGGRQALLYFPPGTYLLSNTIRWQGCCIGLQGAGSGQTILRLRDASAGYGDRTRPKPVIQTPDGNASHQQNIWDLTIDTGRNNPGAIGLSWIANNTGAVRGVVIRSGDGRGVAGLEMTRAWPGPSLVRDLQVSGFEVGIDIATGEYGPVFEDIRLMNLAVAGIRNDSNTVAIRRLRTDLSVPAIISRRDWSLIILLDSQLHNGAAGTSAVQVEGDLFARNVQTSGYASAISADGVVVAGSSVTEYVRGTTYTLDPGSIRTSLNLPIAEMPFYHDASLANWGKFASEYSADWGIAALQALFNNATYSTIYFPTGASIWHSRISVPPHVRRIVGYMHRLNDYDGRGLTFVVDQNSATPLIIEGFSGAKVEHASPRTVIIKHSEYNYTALPGAGDVFFDDVVTNNIVFQPNQRVWGRQFNIECYCAPTMITNQGARVWIFGMKTEGMAPILDTRAGGWTELFANQFYPAIAVPQDRAALTNSESHVMGMATLRNFVTNGMYRVMARETRGGVTRELLTTTLGNTSTLPFYVGGRRWVLGDVNGDAAVTLTDFSLLAASFNRVAGGAGYNRLADLNFDGAVSLADFSTLASNFNRQG